MNILFIGTVVTLISEALSILFATLVSFAFYLLSMAVILFIFALMVKNAQ
jgi:hypothetical protein